MHINGMGAESGFYTASSLEIKTERRVCIMYVCMYVFASSSLTWGGYPLKGSIS